MILEKIYRSCWVIINICLLMACQHKSSSTNFRNMKLIEGTMVVDSIPNGFTPVKQWKKVTLKAFQEEMTLKIPQKAQAHTSEISYIDDDEAHITEEIIIITFNNKYHIYIKQGDFDVEANYEASKKYDAQYKIRTNYQLLEMTDLYSVHKALEEETWFYSVSAKKTLESHTFYTHENELIYYDYGREPPVRLSKADCYAIIQLMTSLEFTPE